MLNTFLEIFAILLTTFTFCLIIKLTSLICKELMLEEFYKAEKERKKLMKENKYKLKELLAEKNRKGRDKK